MIKIWVFLDMVSCSLHSRLRSCHVNVYPNVRQATTFTADNDVLCTAKGTLDANKQGRQCTFNSKELGVLILTDEHNYIFL